MDTIQVSVRLRPLNSRELSQGHSCSWTRLQNTLYNKETKVSFSFDRVFDVDNDDYIYESSSRDLVSSVMNGFNATIIAYGQTSSGKTHTMIGSSSSIGIIPKAIADIFKCIQNVFE